MAVPVWIVVLAVSQAHPLARPHADAGTPDQALAQLGDSVCDGFEHPYWLAANVRRPCELVEEAVRRKATRAQLKAELGEAYGTNERAAAALADAAIYRALAESSRRVPAGWRESAALSLEALRADPMNTALLAIAMNWSSPANDPGEVVFAALEKNPQASQLIRRLTAEASNAGFYWEEAAVAFLVARRPGEALPVLADFGLDRARAEATVIYLGMLRQLEAKRAQGPAELVEQLTDRVVRNLLEEELTAGAFEVLDRAEEQVRRRVLAGEVASQVRSHYGGPREKVTLSAAPDARSALAIGLAELGRDELAKELWASLPPLVSDKKRPWEACGEEVRRALLRRLYGQEPRGDAFEDAVALHGCRDGASRFVAARALGPRYFAVLEQGLRYFAERAKAPDLSPPIAKALPQEAAFLAGQVERRRRAAQALLAARAPPDAGVAAAEPGDAGTPLSLFTEAPLPAGVKAQPLKGEGPAKIPGLPRGFWGVRAISHDGGTLVIAASQAVDPTGEVTRGGYWLLHSADGGGFHSPLYLGLRDHRPYVLTPRSELKPLHGDTLQLEAQVQRIDDQRIIFPPVNDARAEVRGGIWLKASLAELRRDTDDDGITDLLEERLGLDPRHEDTDRDGQPDSTDLLPNLGKAKVRAPDAELLSAVFASFDGADRQDDGPEPPAGVRFLLADPARVAGIRTIVPTIVLSPVELARMQARFGAFYPFEFSLVLWNEQRDQALVVYDESWRGGSLLARRVKGRWVITRRGGWIT